MDTDGPSAGILILLLILSAYFSASETAFSSYNRIRIKNYASNEDKRAQRAQMVLNISEDFDRLLSTILVGNNIVNIAIASMTTVIVTQFAMGHYGVPIATAISTAAILLVGEITPKSFAKEFAEVFTLRTVGLMRIIMVVLTPITFLFQLWKMLVRKFIKSKDEPNYTDEELMTIVDEAETEGVLEKHEVDLIRSAIEFDDLNASDIAIPRVDITAVEINAPMEEIDLAFATHGYSRLPVYRDTIDNIIGMIHEKDFHYLYRAKVDSLNQIISNVVYATENTKISLLLKQLQVSKTHMAIIADEFGGTFGLVTMEDILEELVGDIWDEHDEIDDKFRPIDDKSTLVSCHANLIDMFEYFQIDFKNVELESNTVNGWVIEQFNHLPNPGETFQYQNVEVLVTKSTHKAVTEIKVTRLDLPEAEEATNEKSESEDPS